MVGHICRLLKLGKISKTQVFSSAISIVTFKFEAIAVEVVKTIFAKHTQQETLLFKKDLAIMKFILPSHASLDIHHATNGFIRQRKMATIYREMQDHATLPGI